MSLGPGGRDSGKRRFGIALCQHKGQTLNKADAACPLICYWGASNNRGPLKPGAEDGLPLQRSKAGSMSTLHRELDGRGLGFRGRQVALVSSRRLRSGPGHLGPGNSLPDDRNAGSVTPSFFTKGPLMMGLHLKRNSTCKLLLLTMNHINS